MQKTKTFLMAGGIGNQLFIYVAGTYYSIQNKQNVIFDVSNRIGGIPSHGSDIGALIPDLILRNRPFRLLQKNRLKKLLNWDFSSIYESPEVGYDSALENHILSKQIFGYFQTYKYLEHPKVRQLLNSLVLVTPSDIFVKYLTEMLEVPTISVHVRRGDYWSLRESFGLLNYDYFDSALKFTLENSPMKYERILVFSDDIDAAKCLLINLKIPIPLEFVNLQESHAGEALILMSKSDALIMSNSSFSWWAAQLGNTSKFVVCPSKWLRDMLDPLDLKPPEWHQIDSQWEK
jgi:hypothetical protein